MLPTVVVLVTVLIERSDNRPLPGHCHGCFIVGGEALIWVFGIYTAVKVWSLGHSISELFTSLILGISLRGLLLSLT